MYQPMVRHNMQGAVSEGWRPEGKSFVTLVAANNRRRRLATLYFKCDTAVLTPGGHLTLYTPAMDPNPPEPKFKKAAPIKKRRLVPRQP